MKINNLSIKLKSKYLSFLMVINLVTFWSFEVFSQTVIIGSGTNATTSTGSDPIDGYFASFRYQVVYTAAELTASGMPANVNITGMGFSIAGDYGGGNLLGYTIKIGNTTATNSATHDASATTTVKNAFSYNPTVTAAGAFDMITFDTPFMWNGTSNLLIDICSSGSNPFTSPYGQVRIIAASTTNGSRYVRADGGTSQCGVTTSTINTTKPQVCFAYATAAACSGTPNPGNTLTTFSTVASGQSVTLSLQNATTGSGVTYQWQSSATGIAGSYSNISGATNSSYIATITSNQFFQCIVTCSGASTTSNPVQITLSYCTSTGSTSTYYINNFSTTGGSTNISNISSGYSTSGFGNFTSASVSQVPGGTFAYSASFGSSTTYSFGFGIWVDWNNDMDFADVGENMYVSTAYNTSYNGNITVPSTVAIGNYRMRIVANYNSTSPTACNSTSISGETEEYTISVVAPQVPVISNVSVGSACAQTSTVLTITGTSLTNASAVTIGSTSFTTFTSNTSTSITLTLSANISGQVSVTNAVGTSNQAGPISFQVSPVFTLSTSSLTICAGQNSSPVTLSSGANDYQVFTWSNNSGVSGNSTNGWVFNGTSSANYTLTATQSNGSCSSTQTVAVTVKSLPNVNAGSDVAICPGQSASIGGSVTNNTTILSESFNGNIPANWTITSNLTGGDYRTTLGTTSNGNTWSGTGYSSNCAFFYSYLVASGVSGSLTSPSMNLSNYSSASASFWIYNSNGTDVMRIYISNNGGAPVQIGAASYGIYTTWTQITLDLSAYVGSSNVKIIFTGTSDYGTSNIGIDEFNVIANQSISYTWSNSSSLSNGSVSNPVASPAITTTYTVTGTLNGCSASDEVIVTVNDPSGGLTNSLTSGTYVWRGGQSSVGVTNSTSAYNLPANWYIYNGSNYSIASALPGYSNDIVIPASSSCVTSSPRTNAAINLMAKKITVKNGGTLTFDSNGVLEARDNVIIESGGTVDFQGNGIFIIHNGDFTVNGTFNAGNGTVEFYNDTTHDHFVNTSNSSLTFYDLYITGSANSQYDLHLLHDIQVQNVLSLTTRKLNLNNFGIDLGTTGFVVNESNTSRLHALNSMNYGNGYIKATRVINANTTIDIANLGLTLTTHANQMGLTTIRRYHYSDTITGSTYNSTSRIYDVSPTYNGADYGGNLDVDIAFKYFDSELNLLNSTSLAEADLRLYRSSDDGLTWEFKGGQIDVNTNELTFSGIEHFSQLTLSPVGPTATPVELLNFSAACADNQIKVQWSTASEFNSSHFQLFKSRNAMDWISIAEIPSAGNSNQLINYEWIDESVGGTTYYKLAQFDLDGTTKNYPLISVSCANSDALTVYPNPITDYLVISSGNFEKYATIEIVIVDAYGKQMSATQIQNSNASEILINEIELVPGVYQIIIKSNDQIIGTDKIIKQ